MSYNESLGKYSNYPPMSQTEWDNAPFNMVDLPEREFNVMMSQTLSKSTTVKTDNYDYEGHEDGYDYFIKQDEIEYCYKEQHLSPLELIGECKKILSKNYEENKDKYTKWLIGECEGWVEDDCEIMEE